LLDLVFVSFPIWGVLSAAPVFRILDNGQSPETQ
jgi:hypothetical protein